MFNLARTLKKTVNELLTGVPGPLSNSEYVWWLGLFKLEAAEEKAREAKAKREANRRGRRR